MVSEIEIAGIGFASVDYLCTVSHIPMDEKTEAIGRLVQGGGASATAIVAASKLGARTAFIGIVGDDQAGTEIISSLQKEKIDTGYIRLKAGSTSSVAFCWVEQKTGKRSIVWSKGTAMPLTAATINPAFISSLKVLHLDGHNIKPPYGRLKPGERRAVLDAGSVLPGIALATV